MSDQEVMDYMDEIKYGEEDIIALCALFPDTLDETEALIEWEAFRYNLAQGYRTKMQYKPFYGLYLNDRVWRQSNMYMSIIATIMIVLTLSSCNTERVFSIMNIIKTFLTNRLDVSLVNDILILHEARLCSSDAWTVKVVVEQYGQEIVRRFKKIKKRRGPYKK